MSKLMTPIKQFFDIWCQDVSTLQCTLVLNTWSIRFTNKWTGGLKIHNILWMLNAESPIFVSTIFFCRQKLENYTETITRHHILLSKLISQNVVTSSTASQTKLSEHIQLTKWILFVCSLITLNSFFASKDQQSIGWRSAVCLVSHWNIINRGKKALIAGLLSSSHQLFH